LLEKYKTLVIKQTAIRIIAVSFCPSFLGSHGTQQNDTRHNDTQLNDTRHNDTQLNDTQLNDTQLNDTQLNDTQDNVIQRNGTHGTQHNSK